MSEKYQERRGTKCYLLDSKYNPLARAMLESPPGAENWIIRILDDKTEEVMAHQVIQLVSMSDDVPTLLGRIQRRREEVIFLEPLRELEGDVRQNLRMPVRFESFLYPLTGKWRGRLPVLSNDLSCGGVSFFCPQELAPEEQMEVIIPTAAAPLVIKCEIIRKRPSNTSVQLYAAKFVDLIDDEEMRIREQVFSIQLKTRPKTIRTEETV